MKRSSLFLTAGAIVFVLAALATPALPYSETPICTGCIAIDQPMISGDKIVWEDQRNYSATGWNIYMYDLSDPASPTNGVSICTAPHSQSYPAISGDKIVWQDARNFPTTGWNIYTIFLLRGTPRRAMSRCSRKTPPQGKPVSRLPSLVLFIKFFSSQKQSYLLFSIRPNSKILGRTNFLNADSC